MEQTETLLKRFDVHRTLASNLQKNNVLTNYKAFNKWLFRLTENISELEILAEGLQKPLHDSLVRKDVQKNNLVLIFRQVAGILNLVEGKRSKKIKKIYQSDKKLEKISDKQLLNVCRSAIAMANKLGGFTLGGFGKITSKALQNKFEKARKLSEDLGLTADKVKKLEEASLAFARTVVEARDESKERNRIIKRATKLLDSNDRIIGRHIDKFVDVYEKPGSSFSVFYNKLREDGQPRSKAKELAEL